MSISQPVRTKTFSHRSIVSRLTRTLLCVLAIATMPAVVLASTRADDGKDEKITRGDGFDLYYHTIGAGEPIVLLSGGPGMDVDLLKPVAVELGHDYQCVLLEQRGTGRSRLKAYSPATLSLDLYVEDLDALRDHLKLDKLTLLGNSWGMMLALAYATAHPDRVRAIVTMGSGPIDYQNFPVFNDNIRSRLWPTDRDAELRAQRQRDREAAVRDDLRAILPGYFYDHELGERYAHSVSADLFNASINGPVMGGLLRAHFDLRPGLRGVTAPVLLLQGRQDPAGEANLYEAHEALSGSRLEFLEKCGHLPWVEQPDRFYRACRLFLGEVYGHPVPDNAPKSETIASAPASAAAAPFHATPSPAAKIH